MCAPFEDQHPGDALKITAAKALQSAIAVLGSDAERLRLVREQAAVLLWRHLEYFVVVLRPVSGKQCFFSIPTDSSKCEFSILKFIVIKIQHFNLLVCQATLMRKSK